MQGLAEFSIDPIRHPDFAEFLRINKQAVGLFMRFEGVHNVPWIYPCDLF